MEIPSKQLDIQVLGLRERFDRLRNILLRVSGIGMVFKARELDEITKE